MKKIYILLLFAGMVTVSIKPSEQESLNLHRRIQYDYTRRHLDFIQRLHGRAPIDAFFKKIQNPDYGISIENFRRLRCNPILGCIIKSDGTIDRYVQDAFTCDPARMHDMTTAMPSECMCILFNRYLPEDKKYSSDT